MKNIRAAIRGREYAVLALLAYCLLVVAVSIIMIVRSI